MKMSKKVFEIDDNFQDNLEQSDSSLTIPKRREKYTQYQELFYNYEAPDVFDSIFSKRKTRTKKRRNNCSKITDESLLYQEQLGDFSEESYFEKKIGKSIDTERDSDEPKRENLLNNVMDNFLTEEKEIKFLSLDNLLEADVDRFDDVSDKARLDRTTENRNIQVDDIGIKIFSSDGLDLKSLHNLVITELEKKISQKIVLKQEIEDLVNRNDQTIPLLLSKIATKTSQIEKINKINISSIQEQSEQIISLYQQINQVDDFSKSEPKHEISDKKESLLLNYISIVKNHISIYYYRNIEKDNNCRYCKKNFLGIQPDNRGCLKCSKCLSDISYSSKDIFGYCLSREEKDPTSENRFPSNVTKNKANFEKAVKRYQGKQTMKIKKDWKKKLDNYFKENNYPISEQVSIWSEDPKKLKRICIKSGLSKKTMYTALKECKLSSQYCNINLICKIYWGIPLPDISHIEKEIFEDFDLIQSVFDKAKGVNRKSRLSSQYILLRLLKKRNHICDVSDFKIVETEEILSYYEHVWSEICFLLEWEYIEINSL